LPRQKCLKTAVEDALNQLDFVKALEGIWGLINAANKYIEETKPWNLKKEHKTKELESFIALLIQVIGTIAEEVRPFMPETAKQIIQQIGDEKVSKGKPLFPRIV
jgi:methionyl-tRNA synthetase